MEKKLIYIIIFLLISKISFAEEISGNANIIDGDSIKIGSKKIRLFGIDAPEIKQKCKYQVPQDIVVSYSSQTVNFELGRIRDDLVREAANFKAEMIKNDIESRGNFKEIELSKINREFDFRIIVDELK